MLGYDELKALFQELGLANKSVIAHASLQPFGYIHNGADTVLKALLDSVKSLVMPTFTYMTMITPEGLNNSLSPSTTICNGVFSA